VAYGREWHAWVSSRVVAIETRCPQGDRRMPVGNGKWVGNWNAVTTSGEV
jgi:hypothetical protein